MNDEFQWWLLLVGMGLGAGLLWLATARLPRTDEDIDEREQLREAEWISSAIEERGGVAPALLVQEVLELHREYLAGPPLEAPEDETTEESLEEPPVAGEQQGVRDQTGERRRRDTRREASA